MHLFVVGGLQQYPTMLSAHGKCVRGLQTRNVLRAVTKVPLYLVIKSLLLGLLVSYRKKRFSIPSVMSVCLRCIPP